MCLGLPLSLVQLSPRDAPFSSVSHTSSIRAGLAREDGRPTLLEEAGTFNKKREAWGNAKEVHRSKFMRKQTFRGSLRGSQSLLSFLEVVCSCRGARCQDVRGHTFSPISELMSRVEMQREPGSNPEPI